jgi:hypothetical protein
MFVAGKSLGKRHIAKILDKGALSARMHITRARIGRPFLSHFMDMCMAVCVSIIMILFFFGVDLKWDQMIISPSHCHMSSQQPGESSIRLPKELQSSNATQHRVQCVLPTNTIWGN